MHKTFKGIYIKFNGNADRLPYGRVEDVLYENIDMYEPSQWPIWIGPAQQSDAANPCHANPCSLCWPSLPGAVCSSPSHATFHNITLRNVTITRPKMSPGVIIGSDLVPMTNITFDGVRVSSPGKHPWGAEYYKCTGVASGRSIGATWPVPPCFDEQDRAVPLSSEAPASRAQVIAR